MSFFDKNKKEEQKKRELEEKIEKKKYYVSYLSLAICIAVDYISSTLSTCSFETYKNNKINKSELFYKLNYKPNKYQNGTDFKYSFISKLLLKEETLIYKLGDDLLIADSFIKSSQSIKGYTFTNIVTNNTNIPGTFSSEDVFYFNLNGSRIKRLLDSLGSTFKDVIAKAFDNFFSYGSARYKVNIDSMKAGSKEFEDEWNEYILSTLENFINSNEDVVYPEFEGYNLQALQKKGENDKDSTDIIKIRKEVFEIVSLAYKIPISMMYGNVSNLNDVVNVYINFAVLPIARRVESEISSKYYTAKDILEEACRVLVNLSGAKYRDIYENADGVAKVLSSGVKDIDEIRGDHNMNSLNTDYSKQKWMTKNNDKIENMLLNIDDNQNLKGGEKDE